MTRAKTWQIDRHESALGAKRVARRERAVARKEVVDAGSTLIVDVMLVANVQVIVAVDAGANDAGRAIHSHAARNRAGCQIWLRDVFLKKELRSPANVLGRNHIVGKGHARIRSARRLARRRQIARVVNDHAAVLKIAADLLRSWNGLGHRISLRVPEALIVEKEERLVVNKGTADRSAKIVLNKKLRGTHGAKGVSVHRPIPQIIVSCAMEGIAARARDDIDLPAP